MCSPALWTLVCLWQRQHVKEVLKESRHGMHWVLRGVIISDRWWQENSWRVERTVNGNTGPACPVILVDSLRKSVVSRSLGLLPLRVQDTLSPTATANRRHPSNWLKNHSLPISPLLWRQLLELVSQICCSMCSASNDIYLHTRTTIHTRHTHRVLSSVPESRSPSEFVCVLAFVSFCLVCWIYSNTIHPNVICFHGSPSSCQN